MARVRRERTLESRTGTGRGGLTISGVVFVFKPCCKARSQTGWLPPTEIYPLTCLEARSRKSRCQQGHAPSACSREESFLDSS